MEGSVALEQEEAHDEGLRYPMGEDQGTSGAAATGIQRVPCYPSSHRELLLWRTLAKILGLSQAALVLMVILLLRLCSQCSQQEAQTQCTPTGSMKEVTSPVTQGAAPGAAAPPCPCLPGNGSCPMNWLQHKGKCYYFSRDTERNWSGSREDCAERDSQLLLIQDQEEKDFIHRQAGDRYHWIGLHIPAPGRNWTWVDGSPFNQTLVSVSGSTEQGRCVVMGHGRFYSDSCSRDYPWICQKEAGKE
ncbi:killer cell lectin-like receptor subfamily B member 1B allele C isoform X2 [Rhinatrema bivittatum]|uniref:killer cell lectin-like receptor subfamily B member 1B allele C isoform X2 n=1 Tax=Rhinatrema bivittatum TaxID=194408 RepID=UPI0011281E9B|nr:killer cell lectin-like receptor subfamily B member 1B allele C isoform X2 [Rhinatrema bivittatum]